MRGRVPRLLVPFALICVALAASPASAAPPEVTDLEFTGPATIGWDPLPGTAGYHVYRGDLAALHAMDYGACLVGSVQGTSTPVPDDPPAGDGYFYLVAGYDGGGHGDLGSASPGWPRTPAPLCVGNRRYFDLVADVAPDGLPSREPLRNPAIEEWIGKRDWTGVVLHSGEFTLSALDPLGGLPKHHGTESAGAPGGGGGARAPLGVGQSIAINLASTLTRASIEDSATVSADGGGGGAAGTGTGGNIADVGVGQSIAINVVDTPTRAVIDDGATLSGGPDPPVTPSSAKPKKGSSWLERLRERYRKWYLSRIEGFERHYRSQISYDGPLGFGWDFPHNARLAPDGGDVAWYDGTGRRWLFHRVSPTEFVSPMGCYARLWEDAAFFSLRFPDGRSQEYRLFDGSNTQGALLRDISLDGNHAAYFYDTHGFLTTIEDDLGRATNFTYDPAGRMIAITDFSGRTVEYGYDAEGNLITVRSPVVTGTPNGNDFPLGKTTTYAYTSGHPDDRFNHNLWTIVSPKENASTVPFLENTYESDPNNFEFDRVTGQFIGGVGSGGAPPAGGGMTYAYVPMNLGGDPFDMALPRREVTVVDRNGNERVWLTNAAGNPIQLTERTNRNLRPGEPDYISYAAYNADGEVTSLLLPEGNEYVFTYDRPGLDRYREGDLLEARIVPDQPSAGGRGDGHGANLPDIVWNYSYDPLGRRISSVTNPMGRQTTWTYDYQEGDPNTNGLAWLEANRGLDLTGIPFLLGDLNGDGDTNQALGKPVIVDLPTVNLTPGSNQALIEGDLLQEIRTVLTWNHHGQITSVLDPEGNRHLLEYYPESDPDGDGTPTPPPMSRTLDTATGGYLKTVSIDTLSAPGRDNGTNPPPVYAETDYEYDSLGNRISSVNGRGVRTSWTYNQLDQVVELRRASATATLAGPHGDPATGRGEAGLPPLGYRVWFFYDENDNLAERRVEEVDGVTGAGPWIETRWTYDILDDVVSQAREAAAATFLTTQYKHDANENLRRRILPVGNADELAYDERDLLLSSTRGVAGTRGGTPSTRQYEYDGNGNLTRLTDGRGGLIDHEYDGADRPTRHVDQVGNTSEDWYDPADNVVHRVLRGPVGGTTPPDRTGATNVDLAVGDYSYDDLNRLVVVERALNLSSGPPPVRSPVLQEGSLDPGDGNIDHIYEYDSLSRLTFDVRDSGAVTRHDYDGAGRILLQHDAGARTLGWTWDDNGNPVELVEWEPPSAPGPPTEVYPTTWFYDALDRLTTEADSAGETRRWLHNSLDLTEMATGPKGPPGGTIDRRSATFSGISVAVNAHGNVTDHQYDGLGRLIQTVRVLTVTGEGDGSTSPLPDTSNPSNPDGLILTATAWDDNSLPLSRTDDLGNLTAYEYDNLNRLVRRTADDGTKWVYEYDPEDNLSQSRDPNGSVIAWGYDPANRPVQGAVTRAPGIIGSTLQEFEYDGLSRTTRAFDINDPLNPGDDVQVQFVYDTLGRVVEEQQTTGAGGMQATSFGWLAEDLKSDLITPGSYQVSYGYDGADRLVQAVSPPHGAVIEYLGRSRVHTRHYGNGLRTTMLDDSGTLDIGYDEARRIRLLRYLDPNDVSLGGYEYRHDRAGNRISMLRLHHTDPNGYVGEIAEYDSAGRLRLWEEAILDAGHLPSGPVLAMQDWTLDGAGNWDSHTVNGLGMNNTPNNNNEYDEPQGGGVRLDDGIPDDFADPVASPPADGVNLAHDMIGNLIFDGTHEQSWDAFGRLVQAVDSGSGLVVAKYSYDPLGRRITRQVLNRGSLDETRRYLYAGLRAVEEQDGGGLHVRTAVPGRGGRDWLWQVTGAGAAQYYLQDAHGSTVGMSDDSSPDVIERVTYTPYGKPFFTDPNNVPLTDPNSGLPLPRSSVGNPLLFAGMRHDPEGGGCASGGWGPECGGLYVTLHRYYSPYRGRFLSRDPQGVWADPAAAGNGYVYAGGNPLNRTDPLGLGPEDDLDLPSGPFVRVEGGVTITIDEFVVLTGNFAFERTEQEAKPKPKPKPKPPIKIGATDVPASIGAGEIEVLFNPGEMIFNEAVPWCGHCSESLSIFGFLRDWWRPAVFAPVPLLKVTKGGRESCPPAYCSSIPYLQVTEPHGEVVTGDSGESTSVVVAVPLTKK